MARPSKTNKHFAIYEDTGIPTPDSSQKPSFDDALRAKEASAEEEDDVFADEEQHGEPGEGSVLDDIEEAEETNNVEPTDTEEEDERRESAFTSISSLPESSSDTDQERSRPMHKPYTPPMIRPSFRRPESVRRMQMASPIPFERSPRRSALHSQSRSGTPRSSRFSVKGSPRPRKQQEEEYAEPEKKEYPLVLLHVSLLPVELRWSMDVMQEVLPQKILDNLQLLRSKVTDTILQRGILIPHPREEYELLEERLLEALELRKERITKCGHFHARDSISSASSEESSINSDSGIGSSVDSDSELCATCRHHLKTPRAATGTGGSKWNIRVFAANGLMRASAWAAAWSEMERVDVEILPWISEDLRRQLDARVEEEEEGDRTLDVELPQRLLEAPVSASDPAPMSAAPAIFDAPEEKYEPRDSNGELPQIYRAKDVPLSLLLRNYLYLLAKDRRNIVIFGLAALAMWLSLRAALAPTPVEISPLPPVCESAKPEVFAMDASQIEGSADVQPVMELNASEATFILTDEEASNSGDSILDANTSEADVAIADDETSIQVESEALSLETLEDLKDKDTREDPMETLQDPSFIKTCENPASTARLFHTEGSLC